MKFLKQNKIKIIKFYEFLNPNKYNILKGLSINKDRSKDKLDNPEINNHRPHTPSLYDKNPDELKEYNKVIHKPMANKNQ